MNSPISPNTQSILLLTAPLLTGGGPSSAEVLSPSEYKRLAKQLREAQREPADLLSPDASELIRECGSVVQEQRLRKLLGRGLLLSQAVERWQARAIWVVSRADQQYPRRLKTRLRGDAPIVLYGCGEIEILETGGLAVVGSRDVDDSLVEYTISVGQACALAGKTIISGGAKGIDQAAMRGALEAGGRVIGVLGDGLERAALNRDHRSVLIDGRLVLVSPYDPGAGFNVGHAMQRNKSVYALADAALVVSSDYGKGGTWAGATEQLDKMRQIPVYVRSTGVIGEGLRQLRQKGALPWPDPKDREEFDALVAAGFSEEKESSDPDGLPLFGNEVPVNATSVRESLQSFSVTAGTHDTPTPQVVSEEPSVETLSSPADVLFASARDVLGGMLKTPMREAEVAAALQIAPSQARSWLQRLVDEGVLEKRSRPARYAIRQRRLL